MDTQLKLLRAELLYAKRELCIFAGGSVVEEVEIRMTLTAGPTLFDIFSVSS
jgi:hypothetical protein